VHAQVFLEIDDCDLKINFNIYLSREEKCKQTNTCLEEEANRKKKSF